MSKTLFLEIPVAVELEQAGTCVLKYTRFLQISLKNPSRNIWNSI